MTFPFGRSLPGRNSYLRKGKANDVPARPSLLFAPTKMHSPLAGYLANKGLGDFGQTQRNCWRKREMRHDEEQVTNKR
jgi:hypothetical protein